MTGIHPVHLKPDPTAAACDPLGDEAILSGAYDPIDPEILAAAQRALDGYARRNRLSLAEAWQLADALGLHGPPPATTTRVGKYRTRTRVHGVDPCETPCTTAPCPCWANHYQPPAQQAREAARGDQRAPNGASGYPSQGQAEKTPQNPATEVHP